MPKFPWIRHCGGKFPSTWNPLGNYPVAACLTTMVLSHAFEECSFTFSSGENPAPLSRLKSLQLDFFLFKIFLRFYGGEFNQHVFMRWHIINPIGRKNATYCIYHLQSMPSGGKKSTYCWWFRNPAITSWYGTYPHYLSVRKATRVQFSKLISCSFQN